MLQESKFYGLQKTSNQTLHLCALRDICGILKLFILLRKYLGYTYITEFFLIMGKGGHFGFTLIIWNLVECLIVLSITMLEAMIIKGDTEYVSEYIK